MVGLGMDAQFGAQGWPACHGHCSQPASLSQPDRPGLLREQDHVHDDPCALLGKGRATKLREEFKANISPSSTWANLGVFCGG